MRKIEGGVHAIIGTQWGDEGKGKIVDHFAAPGDYEVVARPAGGPNAGHTIYVDGQKYVFHGLPEGALYPGVLNVIGPGAVVNPIKLAEEIAAYNVPDQSLAISGNTHLITPVHISEDQIREVGSGGQGSTKSGIAFVNSDKYQREGIPLGHVQEKSESYLELITERLYGLQEQCRTLKLPPHSPAAEAEAWLSAALSLTKYEADTTILLNSMLDSGANIMASGAQSHWLDIDEQPYPYGTSTHTGSGGIVTGLQVPPQAIDRITGVMKSFKSRVGNGPMVSEIEDERLARRLRGYRGEPGAEYGTTSGRPRRVGYLDLPEVRRSIMANGVTELALTKLDLLTKFGREMLVATAYKMPEVTKVAPNQVGALERAEPDYEEVSLWSRFKNDKLKAATSFDELPPEAQKLVKFLEDQLDIGITLIGTGPDRSQIIVR